MTDEDALRNALSTGTDEVVKLGVDMSLDGAATTALTIGTDTNYVLDLNGHTLTLNVAYHNANPSPVIVPAGASLTIINSGADDGKILRGTSTMSLITNRGTLTIGNAAAAAAPCPNSRLVKMRL